MRVNGFIPPSPTVDLNGVLLHGFLPPPTTVQLDEACADGLPSLPWLISSPAPTVGQ